MQGLSERRDDAGLPSCDDMIRGRARNQPRKLDKSALHCDLFCEFALDGTSIAGAKARFGVKCVRLRIEPTDNETN